MSEDVLVLTSGYLPLRRVSWQKCLHMYCNGKIDIVETYEDQVIRTASLTMKKPAVVRCIGNIQIRTGQGGVQFNKKNLYIRDAGTCQFCGKELSLREATIDHVHPRKYGGQFSWDNCVIACNTCNSRKGCKNISPNKIPRRPSIFEFVKGLITLRAVPEQWKPYIL